MTSPDALPAAEHRIVVSWAGQDAPILLKLYGPDGEVASAPLTPVRAMSLARELIEPAVQSIKHSQWGPGWP